MFKKIAVILLLFFGLATVNKVYAGAGTKSSNSLWPGGVVPYVIPNGEFSVSREASIVAGIAHWNDESGTTKITFVPYNSNVHTYYLQFQDDGSRTAWSYIGTIKRTAQPVQIGWTEMSTVVHELGHAIGMYHEQSRPDRDKYITINWANIKEDAKGNFNAGNAYNMGVYDYGSVMHYGTHGFSVNGQPTISSPKPIGQRVGLSDSDIQSAAGLYAGTNIRPTAGNDSYETEGTLTVVDGGWQNPGLLQNDGDYDGDSLTASIISNPSNGRIDSFNASNGSFTYTPNAGFSGTDTFTYRVSDGRSNSTAATVSIEVTGGIITPPPPPPPPPPATEAHLVYNAVNDTNGNSTWENETGNESSVNWALGSGVSRTAINDSAFTAMTHAYHFNGSDGGTMKSLQKLSSDPSKSSASFEFWLRPTKLVGNHMIFETGGSVDGLSVVVNSSGVSFIVKDGSVSRTVASNVPLSTSEFSHVVGVYDKNGTPDVYLYVNGSLAASANNVSSLDDWSGGNNSGLGRVSGGTNTSVSHNFEGDIYSFSFHRSALSAAKVSELYESQEKTGVQLPVADLSYNAVSDINGNSTWENTTSLTGFNWTLPSSASRGFVNSSFSSINRAYHFTGTAGATMNSLDRINPDPSQDSASFEFWLRPANVSGERLLFETGGGFDGLSFKVSSSGITMVVKDSVDTKASGAIKSVTSTVPLSTSEFSHVVGVYSTDIAGNGKPDVYLYVNGVLSASAKDVSGLNDWTGSGGAGLGANNGGVNTSYTGGFEGDIYAFNFYSQALTASEASKLFNAVK